MNVLTFAKCLVVLTVFGLLTACGGDRGAAPASGTPVTAVIGPAGGTLTGPDGVQVVVPAGAVDQPTTIGIARSSAGAPAPLAEGNAPAGPVYEFTPHDLVFNTPVTLRMPVPPNAVGTEVFMAGLGEDWQVNGATVVGGFAEWQRNSFSWGVIYACTVPANNTDPYLCSMPWAYSSTSATPPSAITRTSSSCIPFSSIPFRGCVDSWVVNHPGTVQLTLNYFAAPDCGGASVKLIRWNPAVPLNTPGSVQTLLDQSVTLTQTTTTTTLPGAGIPVAAGGAPTTRGVGSTTFDISSYLTDSVNTFRLTFSCQRPGKSRHTGGDLITFVGSMPAPVGPFTIGGTVSGLTGAGLVLQNNGGNDLPVLANGLFTFATAIAAGTGYSVSVLTQPTGQTCAVQNGTGTNVQANVAHVAVTCTSAGGGGLALVTNSGSDTLSIFRADAGTGVLASVGTVATGDYPFSVAVHPNGLYAYVTNLIGGTISSYSINNITGVLTPISLSSPGTQNPYGIAVDPLGRFVWVANYGFNTVSAFTIGPNGALTASGLPVSSATLPYSITAHPNGNFVYVGNDFANSISVYSVNPSTGVLTLQPGTIANSVNAPHSIAIHPLLNFAYVADAIGGSVAAFSINPSTGALTLIGYFNSGSSPKSVAVHPNGQYAYVANEGSNTVTVFSINQSTGALTLTGSPVATGTTPRSLAINTAGTYVYVTNYVSNSVSAFSISAGGATLTSLGATAPTGTSPEGVAVTP